MTKPVKHAGGRPTVRTPEAERRIFDALRLGLPAEVAAAAAGISRTTFWDWIKEDRQFSDAVLKAASECQARCMLTIQKAAAEHWQAAAWTLERRWPQHYSLAARVEVNGGGDFDRATPEAELRAALAAAQAILALPEPDVIDVEAEPAAGDDGQGQ